MNSSSLLNESNNNNNSNSNTNIIHSIRWKNLAKTLYTELILDGSTNANVKKLIQVFDWMMDRSINEKDFSELYQVWLKPIKGEKTTLKEKEFQSVIQHLSLKKLDIILGILINEQNSICVSKGFPLKTLQLIENLFFLLDSKGNGFVSVEEIGLLLIALSGNEAITFTVEQLMSRTLQFMTEVGALRGIITLKRFKEYFLVKNTKLDEEVIASTIQFLETEFSQWKTDSNLVLPNPWDQTVSYCKQYLSSEKLAKTIQQFLLCDTFDFRFLNLKSIFLKSSIINLYNSLVVNCNINVDLKSTNNVYFTFCKKLLEKYRSNWATILENFSPILKSETASEASKQDQSYLRHNSIISIPDTSMLQQNIVVNQEDTISVKSESSQQSTKRRDNSIVQEQQSIVAEEVKPPQQSVSQQELNQSNNTTQPISPIVEEKFSILQEASKPVTPTNNNNKSFRTNSDEVISKAFAPPPILPATNAQESQQKDPFEYIEDQSIDVSFDVDVAIRCAEWKNVKQENLRRFKNLKVEQYFLPFDIPLIPQLKPFFKANQEIVPESTLNQVIEDVKVDEKKTPTIVAQTPQPIESKHIETDVSVKKEESHQAVPNNDASILLQQDALIRQTNILAESLGTSQLLQSNNNNSTTVDPKLAAWLPFIAKSLLETITAYNNNSILHDNSFSAVSSSRNPTPIPPMKQSIQKDEDETRFHQILLNQLQNSNENTNEQLVSQPHQSSTFEEKSLPNQSNSSTVEERKLTNQSTSKQDEELLPPALKSILQRIRSGNTAAPMTENSSFFQRMRETLSSNNNGIFETRMRKSSFQSSSAASSANEERVKLEDSFTPQRPTSVMTKQSKIVETTVGLQTEKDTARTPTAKSIPLNQVPHKKDQPNSFTQSYPGGTFDSKTLRLPTYNVAAYKQKLTERTFISPSKKGKESEENSRPKWRN